MYIELLAVTPDAEGLIAGAYGTCTSKDMPVTNIPKWIKAGHTSPLEHAQATFMVAGISRSCLAQLTRHRIGMSYSVKSMRYVEEEFPDVVVPQSIVDDEPSYRGYAAVCRKAWMIYEQMIARGIKKEDARFVLPIATSTTVQVTGNFRAWRHFIELRTDKRAQWEIRELANEILCVLKNKAPNVFGDLSANRQKGENGYE